MGVVRQGIVVMQKHYALREGRPEGWKPPRSSGFRGVEEPWSQTNAEDAPSSNVMTRRLRSD